MEEVLNDVQALKAYINIIICCCFFVSIILFLCSYILSRKPKITKKSSEFANVISPILAEVLVDGKIDLKNLILTTIAELQIKGNIAIIGDNVLELIHKNNLNLHEIYLVDMIFQDMRTITFNEINDRFAYERYSSTDFIENINKISKEIQSKLYEVNLFSKSKTLALNITSYLSLLMLINFPLIIMKATNTSILIFTFFAIFLSIMATIIFFSRFFTNAYLIDTTKESSWSKRDAIGILIGFIITEMLCLIVILSVFDVFTIGILGFYAINLLILRKTKNNILSEEGLEERRKVLELKNFLQDYDLRKVENGETFIVWNKYFAYSAAFGIQNPVITEIYKSWNMLDITFSFNSNII